MTVDVPRRRALNVPRSPLWLAASLVVLFSLASVALQPTFLSPRVLQSNLSTFLPLMIIAVGQTYVILGGAIDLSLGALVSLVNVVLVTSLQALGADPSFAAIAACMGMALLVGAAGGAVNGVLVGVLRLQPIVSTFAAGIVFGGIALWIMPQAGGSMPPVYAKTYAAKLFGVKGATFMLLSLVAIIYLISRTRFYIYLLAVGSNRPAAFQSGLPVMRIRVLSYIVAGLFASVTAMVILASTSAGDPLMGQAFTLGSVGAVVLGGTALSGGAGSAIGSMLGAVLLGLINNVLFFAQLPFVYQTIVQGTIILAALAGGIMVSRR